MDYQEDKIQMGTDGSIKEMPFTKRERAAIEISKAMFKNPNRVGVMKPDPKEIVDFVNKLFKELREGY